MNLGISPLAGKPAPPEMLVDLDRLVRDYYQRRPDLYDPFFLGKDAHARSGLVQHTALEVHAANRVETIIQPGDGVKPEPIISRAILAGRPPSAAAS